MDYKNLEMLSWLVGQFRKAGKEGVTYDELIDNLFKEPAMEKSFSKRTFHHYLTELRERFGVKIECDRRLQYDVGKRRLSEENRRYRYRLVAEPQGGDTPWTMPFLWALETSAAMRLLRREEDKEFVYIDSAPSGAENVGILLDAIRGQRCVDLSYKDDRDPIPIPYEDFEPRGLVMKYHVWYLLGNTLGGRNVVWPLSQLSQIKIKETPCRPLPGFSPEKFWKENA
jgi:hypothetical protein